MTARSLTEATLQHQSKRGSDWFDPTTTSDVPHRAVERFPTGQETLPVRDMLACRTAFATFHHHSTEPVATTLHGCQPPGYHEASTSRAKDTSPQYNAAPSGALTFQSR
jgi:hypothetical protein